MLNGETLLSPLLPLSQHQDNVFELLKTWTHGAFLEELLLDDIGTRLQERSSRALLLRRIRTTPIPTHSTTMRQDVLRRMVAWSHKEHEKVMRLSRLTYRVHHPIVADVHTEIVEPDPAFPLSLSRNEIGTQKVAFMLPTNLDALEPWGKEHVDELLSFVLELFDHNKMKSKELKQVNAWRSAL
jgi:hypothetical protein